MNIFEKLKLSGLPHTKIYKRFELLRDRIVAWKYHHEGVAMPEAWSSDLDWCNHWMKQLLHNEDAVITKQHLKYANDCWDKYTPWRRKYDNWGQLYKKEDDAQNR